MAEADRQPNPYVGHKDLREYLQLLEKKGLLHRIKAAVDLQFEIGASKRGDPFQVIVASGKKPK